MQIDWQTGVAFSIVALAALSVIRRIFFGGNSTCGGCHGCADKDSGAASKLVQLSPKKQE